MASVARIINVQVSLFTVAVKVASFDGLMVMDYFAVSPYFPERVQSYGSPEDAEAVLGPLAANAPGALSAVNQAFAQSPQISKVYVGRRANNPLLKVELTPVAFNSRVYKVFVNGIAAQYTSDSSATVAEICDGLASAINAVAGTPVAASAFPAPGSGTKIIILATVSGTWYSIDVDNVNLLKAQQTAADAGGPLGFAADFAAILDENTQWYAFTLTTSGLAENTIALGLANTNKKLFFCATQDWNCLDTTSETSSIASVNHNAAYDYGVVCFHARPSEHIGAAWLGATLTSSPGSITFKFKQLSGVSGDVLTSIQLDNLDAKKANYFVSYGGNNAITAEGFVGSGEFIDVIRDSDWFSARLQARFYEILVNNPKVPFTDKGIKILASALRAQVKEGQDAGFLNDDPATVAYTIPKAADVPAIDKAARLLNGMAISAELAAAVHKVSPLKVNIFA